MHYYIIYHLKKNDINIIMNNDDRYIIIDNNDISSCLFNFSITEFIIHDDEFIEIINILKKCNENTFIVRTDKSKFLEIFYSNIKLKFNLSKAVKNTINHSFSFDYAIVFTDGEQTAIFGKYIELFNKYNIINDKTYIRILKLKKLL